MLTVVILITAKLSVVRQNVILPNVSFAFSYGILFVIVCNSMLSVVMSNAVMLKVVTPLNRLCLLDAII